MTDFNYLVIYLHDTKLQYFHLYSYFLYFGVCNSIQNLLL